MRWRPLGIALFLGLLLPPAPAAALPTLARHGRWLTDPQGRVVILHGLQIDKYRPSEPVEFIDLTRSNVRFLAAQGFNGARVSFAYAGFEPRIGRFDDAYLRSYVAFDRELGGAGVYDLLDMMQGVYGESVGGWGFPDWMTLTDGKPNNHHPFGQGYLDNPAEQAAWDNLWRNTPAADGVGLQDHYARGLARIARALAPSPGLLAIDLLNEPWPGTPWPSCFAPTGCPTGGFDQTSFTDFYRRIIPTVRAADPRHLIAYEPNLLYDFGRPTQIGDLRDPQLLFAFHDYCLATAPGQPPNPAAAASCPASETAVLDNADAHAQAGGGAPLLSEWGATTDLAQLARIADDADRHLMGWMEWSYEDCCNNAAAIVADGTKDPTAPGNLRLPVLNALVRPYPKAVAGTPTSWSYDPNHGTFTLRYTTARVADGRFPPGAESDVEVPALHYPTGYDVHVQGARVISAPDANLLRLRAYRAPAVTLTVTPADHHPRATGPFTWPAAAGEIAPADCPSDSSNVLYLSGAHRIVHLAVFVDGQRVSVLRGPAIERVALPLGLADGSDVRLLARSADGARLSAADRLSRCTPLPAAWTLR